MRVQFGSPDIRAHALAKEIEAILMSGWVSIGEYVEALESYFKKTYNVRYAIGCNSATQGLVIAIKAAGWKNRHVHIPAFTWPSTLYAVTCNSNIPIFHDIDPESWLMDNSQRKLTEGDCIIPVDIFGNMAEHNDYFDKENTIIDAAHGFGLPFLGKRGIAEVVSLSFTKVVTGMEGGMILTDDGELAETATELRRLSARMGEINALVGMESIRNYEPDITKFAINHYKKHITVPYKCQVAPNETNNSVFSLRFESTAVRDAIRIALEKAGIETKVYYDPLQRGHMETEILYNTILSLPTHHEAMQVQDEIIEIINTAGRSARTPGMRYLSS